MKNLTFLLLMALFAGTAYGESKINSKESLRLCKSAMESDLPEGTRYKFKRKTATSVESDRFKHWINVLEVNETEKQSKKLRCETSRSGEVLVLEIRPGKWKI